MDLVSSALGLPGVEVAFGRSPLDDHDEFVRYCLYLYASGSMRSELYNALSKRRGLFRLHVGDVTRLRAAVKEASPGSLALAEEAELAAIEEMDKSVEFLDHARKRQEFTLKKSAGNEDASSALLQKLQASEGELAAKEAELRAARAASGAFQRLRAAEDALQAFYDETGVTEMEGVIKRLQSSAGKASGSRGGQFEALGEQYVRGQFLQEVSAVHGVPAELLRYTANVTLKIPQVTGTAGELDGLVFEIEPASLQQIDCGRSYLEVRRVLAVIEMKRNIDDIGPAYESRLRTMRWLAGMESDIDRELRKNKHYPSGRYDEPFSPTYHHHYDKTIQQIYDFKPGSFEYFRMLELESRGRELLHFFVRPSPLTCVASNDSARIQFALATDFYIDEDAGLGSPANTDPLEVLRLRIKSSSKNKAGVDIADDIIMTSHDVAKICRLHLLIPTNDRTNSSEFGGNNCTNTP